MSLLRTDPRKKKDDNVVILNISFNDNENDVAKSLQYCESYLNSIQNNRHVVQMVQSSHRQRLQTGCQSLVGGCWAAQIIISDSIHI